MSGTPYPEAARLMGDGGDLADEGLLVLEGGFLVERGLGAGLDIEALYCVPAREAWVRGLAPPSIEPIVLSEADIAKIAGYPFHRGVFAIAKRPRPRSAQEIGAFLEGEAIPSTLLALPEAIDPANLGSAARSAAALGCSALLLGANGPDPLSRRALRSSMGAMLSLPWARLEGPEDLSLFSRAGYELAACVLDAGAVDLRDYARPPRLAIVLGNEAFGLSEPWRAACGSSLTLPMLGGTDSLNLAAAAAVFLYALCWGRFSARGG